MNDATREITTDHLRELVAAELAPEPIQTLAVAVTADLDAYRALLVGAPALLELAAEQVRAGLTCAGCPARDGCPAYSGDVPHPRTWPCFTAPAQLRKLAQALRAMEEEEG